MLYDFRHRVPGVPPLRHQAPHGRSPVWSAPRSLSRKSGRCSPRASVVSCMAAGAKARPVPFLGEKSEMEVIIRKSEDAASQLTADLIANALVANPRLVLGLATGRTMEGLYAKAGAEVPGWPTRLLQGGNLQSGRIHRTGPRGSQFLPQLHERPPLRPDQYPHRQYASAQRRRARSRQGVRSLRRAHRRDWRHRSAIARDRQHRPTSASTSPCPHSAAARAARR